MVSERVYSSLDKLKRKPSIQRLTKGSRVFIYKDQQIVKRNILECSVVATSVRMLLPRPQDDLQPDGNHVR